MLLRTRPHSSWTLSVENASADADSAVLGALPIRATVPGTVYTDLLNAGLIADPYLDRNELETPWIGRSGWRYRGRVPASPTAERTDLVFDGLDTLATVFVGGRERLRSRNMFRSYRIALESNAADDVEVVFDSPWGPFDALDAGMRKAFDNPYAHIRKMACNFGWDWGPTLVTAGIWRDVRVDSWSVARLQSTRVEALAVRGDEAWTGRVEVAVELERTETAHDVELTVDVAGDRNAIVIPAGALRTSVTVEVPLAEEGLWWPRGYGRQPLYDVAVRLIDVGTRETLDGTDRRVGFRSAHVRQQPDADGTPFEFVINGRRIPARGFNWIPDDCFPTRVTQDGVAARLQDAAESHANIIRVWGGGLYESDQFYELCDELGLMVWQDFAFACAPYPEHDWMLEEIEAEARENVERLMSHPSLVLWNGNNENWLGWDDWGWKERLEGRPWGETFYRQILPAIVADVSPHAVYWPGSPYSGSPDRYSNDRAHGVVHLWDAWLEKGYHVFLEDRPRFVSEFGWQGPPAWRTLTDAIHDDPLTPTSDGVVHHQKAVDGMLKLSRGLEGHFHEPAGMDDWHWAMQLNQARALTLAIEHFRSLRPLNMGTIVWQLNDCWPVASWAVVDSAGRRRPAWFAVRKAFAPRLATIQDRDGGPALILVNDTDAPWLGNATVRRFDVRGVEQASVTVPFTVGEAESTTVPLGKTVTEPGDPRAEFLVADVDGAERAWWYFLPDREFAYPIPVLTVTTSPSSDGPGAEVTVSSDQFVRDLTLHADRVAPDATSSTALVTLLPGESVTFRITGATGDAEWAAKPVARHAGDLVRG